MVSRNISLSFSAIFLALVTYVMGILPNTEHVSAANCSLGQEIAPDAQSVTATLNGSTVEVITTYSPGGLCLGGNAGWFQEATIASEIVGQNGYTSSPQYYDVESDNPPSTRTDSNIISIIGLPAGTYTVQSTVLSIHGSPSSDVVTSGSFTIIPINAACGDNATNHGSSIDDWPSSLNSSFCSTGIVPSPLPTFPGLGGTVSWTCGGVHGGSDATCTATRNGSSIDGICGDADGGVFYTAANVNAAGLCSPSTPNSNPDAVSGDGTWNWTCQGENGGVDASCLATQSTPTPINGQCGPADGGLFANAGAVNAQELCSAGVSNPPSVTGDGTWNWTCQGQNGGEDKSCSANQLQPQCGNANGGEFYTSSDAQNNGLCGTGSVPSPISLGNAINNQWSWTCSVPDGLSTSCSALQKVDGQCGTHDGTVFPSNHTGGWGSGTFCAAGTAPSPDPAIPNTPGGSTTWTCGGINGGISHACSASMANTAGSCDFELSLTPSPLSTTVGSAINLTASVTGGSDCTGSPSYDWDLDGNGSFETTGASSPQITSFSTPGNKTLNLQAAWDGVTRYASATVNITSSGTCSFSPALNATPGTVIPNQSTTLIASASGAVNCDGSPIYNWDLDGNGTYETPGGGNSTRTTSFTFPGSVNVGVEIAWDGTTATATDIVNVLTQGSCTFTPGLVATPDTVSTGENVTLVASAPNASNCSGSPSYQWDLDGNGTYETFGGTQNSITTTFANSGIVIPGVQISWDGTTQSASDTVTVSGAPVSCTFDLVLVPDPSSADIDEDISFRWTIPSFENCEGEKLVSFDWENDGTDDYTYNVSEALLSHGINHAYDTSGNKTAKVTIIWDGTTQMVSAPVTIYQCQFEATPSITPAAVNLGESQNFSANITGGAGCAGNIAYEWWFDLDKSTRPTPSPDYTNSTSSTTDSTSFTYLTAGLKTPLLNVTWDGVTKSYDLQTSVSDVVPECTLTSAPGDVRRFPLIGSQQAATLTWQTINATSAFIDNGIGTASPLASGTIAVTPSAPTTYTMIVTGPGGSNTCNATVEVENNLPPVVDFYATPVAGIAPTSVELHIAATDPESDDLFFTFYFDTGKIIGHPTINTTPALDGNQLDYDDDGVLTRDDIDEFIQIAVVTQTCPSGKFCDINGDGFLNASDALFYIRFVQRRGQYNTPVMYSYNSPGTYIPSVTVIEQLQIAEGVSVQGSPLTETDSVCIVGAPALNTSFLPSSGDAPLDVSFSNTLQPTTCPQGTNIYTYYSDTDTIIGHADIETTPALDGNQLDYDDDGVLTASDMNLMIQYSILGVPCPEGKYCDINNDGTIGALDIFPYLNFVERSGSFSPNTTFTYQNAGNYTARISATERITLPSGEFANGPISTSFSPITAFGCGDAIVQSGEQCDDGNANAGDGCDALCQWEQEVLSCTPKPANTDWNTAEQITRTCQASDGIECTSWDRDNASVHNITASGTECRFQCLPNYTWDGDSCEPNSQLAACDLSAYPGNTLPQNAQWNTVDQITQTWIGTEWWPSNTAEHNLIPTTQECHFRCEDGYGWDGIKCLDITETCGNGIDEAGEQCDDGNTNSGDGCSQYCQRETRAQSCSSKPEPNTIWNIVDTITQICDESDGSACTSWSPDTATEFDPIPTTQECHFRCDDGYGWNGSACVALASCGDGNLDTGEQCDDGNTNSGDGCSHICTFDNRPQDCSPKPEPNTAWNLVPSIMQQCTSTENESCTTWTPDINTEFDLIATTQECHFDCADNYTWDGDSCEPDTQIVSCTSKPDSTEWNSVDQILQTWDGDSWEPQNQSVRNDTPSTSECRYRCPIGTTWNETTQVCDDTSPPTTLLISYIDGFTNATAQDVLFSAQDPHSGISNYTLYERTAPLSSGVCGTYTAWNQIYSGLETSFSIEMEHATCYQFYMKADNGAVPMLSNQTASDPALFTTMVDTVQPLCGNWTPDEPAPWSVGDQDFTLSDSTDAHSGIAIGGGTCTVSNHNEQCEETISDNASNVRTCSSPPAQIDTTEPTIAITGAPGIWQNSDATGTVTCVDTESGCDNASLEYQVFTTRQTSCPDSGYTPGASVVISENAWVCARGSDLVGNVGTSVPFEFRIDKTPPVCGDWTPAPVPWTNGTQAFTNVEYTDEGGSAIDAQNTVDQCVVSLDDDDGKCTITLIDTATNQTECESPVAQFDTELPLVTFDPEAPQNTLNQIQITLTASDTGGSGVQQARYVINGTATSETGVSFDADDPIVVTLSTSSLGAGEHTISWWVRDNAGNENIGTSGLYTLRQSQGGNIHNSAFGQDMGWMVFGRSSLPSNLNPNIALSFNEGSGNTTADSGSQGLSPSIEGATWKSSGYRGNALSFDGSGDAVVVGNLDTSGWQEITVSAWFQTTENNGAQRIVSKDQVGVRGNFILWYSEPNWVFQVRNKDTGDWHRATYTSSAENDGQWHHILGIVDQSDDQVKLYMDGVLVATTEFTASTLDDSEGEEIVIGADSDVGSFEQVFNGTIDEVQILSRALTPEELFGYGGIYTGVTIADTDDGNGNFSVSGEAYSVNNGIVNFDTAIVTQNGNWAVMHGNATFPGSETLVLASDSGFNCEQLVDISGRPFVLQNFSPTTGDHGVCIDVSTGHMYGHAWSDQFGWVTFGDDTALSTIGTPPVVDDPQINANTTYQTTTSWSQQIEAPITIEAASDIFLANETIADIPIAKVTDGEVGSLTCDFSTLQVRKILPSASYANFKTAVINGTEASLLESTPFSQNIDYSFNCVDGGRSVRLRLEGGTAGQIADTAGLYYLSGSIGGIPITSSADNTKLQGTLGGDPVVYQILPTDPCWDCTNGSRITVNPQIADADHEFPVADLEDAYRVSLELRDRFENNVDFVIPLWFDPGQTAVFNEIYFDFDDRISPVQIIGDPNIDGTQPGDATRYQDSGNTTNIPGSGILTPIADYRKRVRAPVTNTTSLMEFTISAMAPTNYIPGATLTEDNRLMISDIVFERTAEEILLDNSPPPTVPTVEQFLDDATADSSDRPVILSTIDLGEDNELRFLPLFASEADFSGAVSILSGRSADFDVTLTQRNEGLSPVNLHWIQTMKTGVENGIPHAISLINFTQFYPTSTGNPVSSPEPQDEFEMAAPGSSSATSFPSLRSGNVHSIDTLPINDTDPFEMIFTPMLRNGISWNTGDRILYESYVAYSLAGVNIKYLTSQGDPATCAEFPNSPGCAELPEGNNQCSLQDTEECCELSRTDPDQYGEYAVFCPVTLNEVKVAVVGPTYGGVVSSQISNTEAVSFENGFISYEEVQSQIRRNVADLVRNVDPVSITARMTESWTSSYPHRIDNIHPDFRFESINDLFANGDRIGARLEENNVLWISSGYNPGGDTCTIVIDHPNDTPSVLPGNPASRTIISECNLYLKDDIMGGNGRLGIILLRNRSLVGSDGFARSGNFFVDPSVNNIGCIALFAEGSMMMMDETHGIYDGFTSDNSPDVWNSLKGNQLYTCGSFATRNTVGGTALINEFTSGVVGIANADILMPPGVTRQQYANSNDLEWKKKVAEMTDLRMMRNFVRAFVRTDDQDDSGYKDIYEDDDGNLNEDCGVTINCLSDPDSPRIWVPASEDMLESERFDGQVWTSIVNYDADGIPLDPNNDIEEVKHQSAVIFEYDPVLRDLRRTPVGFFSTSAVGTQE